MIKCSLIIDLTCRYGILLFSILLTGCVPCGNKYHDPPLLIIRNINVIDVLDGKIIPQQDIVVKDQIISFLGPSFSERIPAHSTELDGSGQFICPGLWDMHFHLCWDKNNDTLLFPLLLKNGITGIRDMGGDLRIMRGFKEELKAGKISGPAIIGPGPMIDGNPPVYADFSLAADTMTDITNVLDSLKNIGADFFKTYSLIEEPELKRIAVYCDLHRMQFSGHLSEYVDPEISIALGQKSIEHLNRLDEIWETDSIRLDSIGKLMLSHNTFWCPTLITYQLKTRVRDSTIQNHEYARYISSSLLKEWKDTWAKRLLRHNEADDLNELKKTYTRQLALVSHLYKMGVLILGGSDFAGMPYVYPGISLHQELEILVEAGLSNVDALKTVTINPANYMAKERLYGSVAVGKFADLLILDKNPLEDIDHLSDIRSVIVKGKIITYHN